jgi:glucose-6-phosphate 1-dehydrogenase
MKRIVKTKPFILTIFGASGDLAQIKIFPVLYELLLLKKFPERFYIVGFARTEMTRKQFQTAVAKSIQTHSKRKIDSAAVKKLVRHVYYFQGTYKSLADFERYGAFLSDIAGERKNMPHLAYMAVPPVVFKDIIRNLGMTRKSERQDIRLIVEKPFGEDRVSAERLFHFASQYFDEDQFYLLDHYLGKSAVRSILHLRHENRILSNILRGREIANIQITAFEDYGVRERAGYFDQSGMIKDMIQSHLLQLLAFVTMSIPIKISAETLQQEKYGVLSAIDCPCDEENLILGQYKGYKKEPGILARSRTETFAAIRFFINRESWYHVPVYIRTGKKMHEKHTYIVVEFKKFPFQSEDEEPNRLIIELFPNEQVIITLVNKQEDIAEYQQIMTSDSIACDIEGCLLEHSVLLLDVLRGDKIHFLSFAEIIAAWNVVDQLSVIAHEGARLETYTDGSKGPKAQHRLTDIDGFTWYDTHAPR